MKNFNLLENLKNYVPYDNDELLNTKQTIKFLQSETNCFDRSNLKAHITGGALVVGKNNKVLLNYHKANNGWYQFGGHSDKEENTSFVALREVMEESGLTDLTFLVKNIFDVDIQQISDRPKKNEPAHLHYDINFLLFTNQQNFAVSDESKELRWVSLENAFEYVKQDKALTRMLEKYKKLLAIKA